MLRVYSRPAPHFWFVARWLSFVASILPLAAQTPQPARTEEHITTLKRGGDLLVFRYVPGRAPYSTRPRAVIIFGSGDGGYLDWENRVSKAFQADGFEVLGFISPAYASTDYDLPTLQSDIDTIAQTSLSRYGANPPPLILSGWSMGAEQMVPAAGGPHRPKGLVGLLLISPGSRGRYGLRLSDKVDIPPTGAGTFALQDFSHSLDGLRIVQWNASLDVFGSDAWIKSLTAVHQDSTYTGVWHDYSGACDEFLAELNHSLDWILSPPPATPAPTVSSPAATPHATPPPAISSTPTNSTPPSSQSVD